MTKTGRRGFLGRLLGIAAVGVAGPKLLPAPADSFGTRLLRIPMDVRVITAIDQNNRIITLDAPHGLRGLVDDGTFGRMSQALRRTYTDDYFR